MTRKIDPQASLDNCKVNENDLGIDQGVSRELQSTCAMDHEQGNTRLSTLKNIDDRVKSLL